MYPTDKRPARLRCFCVCLALCACLAGCAGSGGAGGGTRDATPAVLVPEAPGTETLGTGGVTIDISNRGEGYIMVKYEGDNPRIKVQIARAEQDPYTYDLAPGGYETYPLSEGDGAYAVSVFENLQGTEYALLFRGEFDVRLNDPFRPFLYPNQFVRFSADNKAIAATQEIADAADDDLGAVELIYSYVTSRLSYDYDKAGAVLAGGMSGYLPDIDEAFETKKGICFDYAALMTAMLRAQGIPSQLVIGYAGEVYHAWINVYIENVGWIGRAIYFDGTDWTLMDPTFASTSGSAKTFTGDGTDYHKLFVY